MGTPVVVWLGLILVHGLAPSLWLGAYPADPLSMFHDVSVCCICDIYCHFVASGLFYCITKVLDRPFPIQHATQVQIYKKYGT